MAGAEDDTFASWPLTSRGEARRTKGATIRTNWICASSNHRSPKAFNCERNTRRDLRKMYERTTRKQKQANEQYPNNSAALQKAFPPRITMKTGKSPTLPEGNAAPGVNCHSVGPAPPGLETAPEPGSRSPYGGEIKESLRPPPWRKGTDRVPLPDSENPGLSVLSLQRYATECTRSCARCWENI